MSAKKIVVSDALARAVNRTWQAISADGGEFCNTKADCVELCIDADRLTMFGDSPEAAAELTALLDAHGWRVVLKALCQRFAY